MLESASIASPMFERPRAMISAAPWSQHLVVKKYLVNFLKIHSTPNGSPPNLCQFKLQPPSYCSRHVPQGHCSRDTCRHLSPLYFRYVDNNDNGAGVTSWADQLGKNCPRMVFARFRTDYWRVFMPRAQNPKTHEHYFFVIVSWKVTNVDISSAQ